MRDLLDGSLAAAGPKKASSPSLNPADRGAILPLLRLAAEVGQNNIPQVEGGPVFAAICSTLLSGPCFPPLWVMLSGPAHFSPSLQFHSSKV